MATHVHRRSFVLSAGNSGSNATIGRPARRAPATPARRSAQVDGTSKVRPRSAAMASASRPSRSPRFIRTCPRYAARGQLRPAAAPRRAAASASASGRTTAIEEPGVGRAVGVVDPRADRRVLEVALRQPLLARARPPSAGSTMPICVSISPMRNSPRAPMRASAPSSSSAPAAIACPVHATTTGICRSEHAREELAAVGHEPARGVRARCASPSGRSRRRTCRACR